MMSACIINLPFWKFPYNLQVKRYSELNIVTSKCRPNSRVPQNNVAHGGFILGKQRVNYHDKNINFDSLLYIAILFTYLVNLCSVEK